MVALQLMRRRASTTAHASRPQGFSPFAAAIYGAGTCFLTIAAGLAFYIPEASAVPSYARQTDQPCATCHTAFPELTPYGRQFKLMGYTSGGTRCGDGSARSNESQVPLSVMAWPGTFTHVKNNNNQAALGALPNINNDDWMAGQFSVFVAGQI
jgi:hypothetical protein